MITRVKITADGLLEIIKTIFSDEDINIPIKDGKKTKPLNDLLGVDYYTFKYRPQSTEQIIQSLKDDGLDTNELLATKRAFCCFTLATVDRMFTKDLDQAVCEFILDYWVQTDKIKFVETLFDNANRVLTGVRIPINFSQDGKIHTRYATFIFEMPQAPDFDVESQIGEAARITVVGTLILNPDIVNYYDYEVSFDVPSGEAPNETFETVLLPLLSLSAADVRTQRPVPLVFSPSTTGTINLSRANTFRLNYYGLANKAVDYFADKGLAGTLPDINERLKMTIKRRDNTFEHSVIVMDWQVSLESDTGNEMHILTVTTALEVD